MFKKKICLSCLRKRFVYHVVRKRFVYHVRRQEVTRALARPEDFLDVSADAPDYRRKTGGMVRDTWDDDRAAFVVRDGNYVSARWPRDAHTFARRFARSR